MSTRRTHDGWDLWESGPESGEHRILMLPGGMCSGAFFEPVFAQPALAKHRLVAATVPGMAGTPWPNDWTVESMARGAGKIAADLGCDVLVGHSLGANVALEAAALGAFTGPNVLLSPSFSRPDEAKFLRVLNAVGRAPLLGPLIWTVMMKGMPNALKKHLPEDRRDVLMAELANNDARSCRITVRRYLQYLDQHGSVADRLCVSGVKTWVVFGTNDEIGLTDDERRGLDACATVTMATVPGTHMFLVEEPAGTAALIAEAAATLG